MTDAVLVTESWKAVMAAFSMHQVGELFYNTLFEQCPSMAETLFKGVDMKSQSTKLIEMIDAAIQLLGKPDDLVPVLIGLGERHAGYGVTAEHYPVVAKALITTLQKGLGAAMTPEVTTAWVNIYGVIQGAMLKGSDSPKGQALARARAARLAQTEGTPVVVKVAVLVGVLAVAAFAAKKLL